MSSLVYAIIATAIAAALIFSIVKRAAVKSMPRGNKKMVEISDLINKGAMTFLNAEYRVLAVFVLIVAIALFLLFGTAYSAIFIFGAILSAIAGNIGMRTATSANSRTTQAASKSIVSGFKVAFSSGSVMSFAVVGLGLLDDLGKLKIVGGIRAAFLNGYRDLTADDGKDLALGGIVLFLFVLNVGKLRMS